MARSDRGQDFFQARAVELVLVGKGKCSSCVKVLVQLVSEHGDSGWPWLAPV